jgi:hypothetical protein
MPTQSIASDKQRKQLTEHLRKQLRRISKNHNSTPEAPHEYAGLSVNGRERFILFAPPLVSAILKGRKLVTRRLAGKDKKPPGTCPFGITGDRLWVREKWGYRRQFFDRRAPNDGPFVYAADGPPAGAKRLAWRASLHMPRSACRLVLNVRSTHCERLTQITKQDALDEGCPPEHARDPIGWFRELWDSLTAGKGCGWVDNPWVWVIRFAKAEDHL